MPNYLGQLIRDARHRAGLTLDEVGERVGVTPGALSHIESGRRLPQGYNAVAIAETLGIPRDEILRALDDEHASRRRSAIGSSASLGASQPRVARSAAPPPLVGGATGNKRLYAARPIDDLFADPAAPLTDASQRAAYAPTAAPSPSSRQMARWSADTQQRLAALEQLADSAAEAIRTLRGLVDDEDPAVRREARRLLRELDVRVSEE